MTLRISIQVLLKGLTLSLVSSSTSLMALRFRQLAMEMHRVEVSFSNGMSRCSRHLSKGTRVRRARGISTRSSSTVEIRNCRFRAARMAACWQDPMLTRIWPTRPLPPLSWIFSARLSCSVLTEPAWMSSSPIGF
jgi:hypothetical protein